ncbi:MAG: protein-(glutamine-N5) methyltransferase, release factor glutamine methyltransferase [Patescibacteria group bacterium]|nr:protein-(glutamine-N5) methyltransferase, release factor glutamine methyltransferase [Patescibacteria group bacterium]
MKRIFTPYELAQLAKHTITDFDLEKISKGLGETFLDIPVEYITGFCEFRKHDFQVSRDTLIPRIETEEMIDIGLECAAGILEKNIDKKTIAFADIGTGSGIIGISFANELSEKGIITKGTLSDISPNALEIAKQNAKRILGEENDLAFLESNLLENFPVSKFDIVFANLPYIPSGNMKGLDSSVKDFEPVSALDGGPDGLDLVRKLLQQAPAFLNQDGIVILEVDDSHLDATEFLENFHVEIRKDQFGNNRFWILKLK